MAEKIKMIEIQIQISAHLKFRSEDQLLRFLRFFVCLFLTQEKIAV